MSQAFGTNMVTIKYPKMEDLVYLLHLLGSVGLLLVWFFGFVYFFCFVCFVYFKVLFIIFCAERIYSAIPHEIITNDQTTIIVEALTSKVSIVSTLIYIKYSSTGKR